MKATSPASPNSNSSRSSNRHRCKKRAIWRNPLGMPHLSHNPSSLVEGGHPQTHQTHHPVSIAHSHEVSDTIPGAKPAQVLRSQVKKPSCPLHLRAMPDQNLAVPVLDWGIWKSLWRGHHPQMIFKPNLKWPNNTKKWKRQYKREKGETNLPAEG